MNKNYLIKRKNNSFFSVIINNIKKIFNNHKAKILNDNIKEKNYDRKKEKFSHYIKNVNKEKIDLFNFQILYRNGKIKEEDMTSEQSAELCSLYDKQIMDLRKSNEIRIQQLLKYKKIKEHSSFFNP